MNAKAYFRYNGIDYFDYDFYNDGESDPNGFFMNRELAEEFFNVITPGFVPQKGMKAYVIPGCKRAIADIRKDYVIKRNYQDADFIIKSTTSNNYNYSYRFNQFLIVPSRKAFIAWDKYTWRHNFANFNDFVKHVIPDYDTVKNTDPNIISFNISSHESSFFYFSFNKFKTELDIALGKITIPVVNLDDLPVYSSNNLDIETLQMVHKIGMEPVSENAKENFIIQLQALNQTNWREYPATMHLLYSILKKARFGYTGVETAGYKVFEKPSALPKSVKEMFEKMWKEGGANSEEDLNLGRQFLQTIVQFDTNKFYTVQELATLFKNARVDFQNFYNLYDNIVKIRPKCLK